MSSAFIRTALVGLLALSVTGCVQPDGPNPTIQGDTADRLHDLSRDLENVAGGDADAPMEFLDDLVVLASTQQAADSVRGFGGKVATALVKKTITAQQAQDLANQLWLTVAATEFNEKQVAALQTKVSDTLVAAGVPQTEASAAAADVTAIQKMVNRRPRRWYEFF